MMAATKGAQQHHAAKPLRVDWQQTYGRSLTELDLASQEFRFTLIRPESTNQPLGDYIEQVVWSDQGNQYNLNTIPVLTGSLTWREDDPDLGGSQLRVNAGHRVRCEVKWLGRWMPLWEMRLLRPPSRTVENGESTTDLADDLQAVLLTGAWSSATGNEPSYRYQRDKHHPQGWRYRDIVRDVCRRFQIPVCYLVEGRSWIKHLGDGSLNGSPPGEVIRQAVVAEQENTGQKLVISWRYSSAQRRFGLHVTSLRRNPVLYTLADNIRSATIEPVQRAMLATAVVAHGSGKGKGGKHIHYAPVKVTSPEAIKRYGYIERHVTVPHADGPGDLRRKAKYELYRQLQPVRNLSTLVVEGIATVRRGDAMRIKLPDYGFQGDAGIMFVTSVEHTLTPSDYSMSLSMQVIDPLDPNRVRADRDAALKRQKHRSRGKKK